MIEVVRKIITKCDHDVFYIFWILLLSILIFVPLFSEGYPSWGDNSAPPILNMEVFNNLSNFTYSDFYHGLVYNANVILEFFLANKIAVVLSKIITNTSTLAFIWVFLPYLTMHICFYLAFKNIFKEKALSFALTVFYMFSLFSLAQIAYGWDTTIYSVAGGILFLSYFIKYTRSPGYRDVVIMALLSTIGLINIAFFYVVLVCSLLYFAFYTFTHAIKLKEIPVLYSSLIFLPIFSLLLNLYWILPTFPMSREVGIGFDMGQIYSSSVLTYLNTFMFHTNLSSFHIYSKIFGFFDSGISRFFYFSFLAITFVYIFKNLQKNKMLKVLLPLYLIFFGLSLGDNFKELWYLFQRLPAASMIRSPQLKFFPILFFLLSLMLGIILQKYRPKKLIYLMFSVVALGVFGFYKGNIFSYWDSVVLPEDYVHVVEFLKREDNKYYTVAEFPPTQGAPKIRWQKDHYVYPIINSMLPNPIVVRTWYDSSVPIYLRDVYRDTYANIAESLGSGGVKYALVHKDYTNFPVRHNFLSAKGMSLVLSGDNIDLYEVEDAYYKALFYSDKGNLEYKRISPVMYSVTANPGDQLTFNHQHDASLNLYDRKDVTATNYYNCHLQLGNFNFCDLLLLGVEPLEGLPLSLDYRNNWILPSDSSGAYVLYYKPQIFFYIGLAVSFLAFVALIVFLVSKRSAKKSSMILD